MYFHNQLETNVHFTMRTVSPAALTKWLVSEECLEAVGYTCEMLIFDVNKFLSIECIRSDSPSRCLVSLGVSFINQRL